VTVETAAEHRHKLARAELATSSMYELLGGEEAIRSLVDRFYELMDADETFATIRAMHQDDLGPMRLGLFVFLSGWLGGPQLYLERHGGICLKGPHSPFAIDHEARDEWVACMERAMRDVGIEERYRELLEPAFEQMAEVIRNEG
jgi:hemoglobin